MANEIEKGTSQTRIDTSNQNQLPRKKSNTKILVGVVIIVVIVILAILFLSMSGQLSANRYKATIYVHVTSAHIANVIDIDLYANGNLFKSDSMTALSS